MAKIKAVTYGEESSVQIADYQYVKVRVEMSAAPEGDEKFEDLYQSIKCLVSQKVEARKEEIRANKHGTEK